MRLFGITQIVQDHSHTFLDPPGPSGTAILTPTNPENPPECHSGTPKSRPLPPGPCEAPWDPAPSGSPLAKRRPSMASTERSGAALCDPCNGVSRDDFWAGFNVFGCPFEPDMANQRTLSSSRLQSSGSKAPRHSPERSVGHLGAVFGDVSGNWGGHWPDEI